jgi:hypothetical protein
MGELERDVRTQVLRDEAVEDELVLGDDSGSLVGVSDVLSQQRRVRVETGVVQAPEHHDALVERLPRDEARRAEPHPVAVDHPPQPGAVGRAEDRRAGEGGEAHVDPSLCSSS